MSANDTLDKKITAKQQKALEALLDGRNREDAALAAGVTARTLYRWLNEPEFAAFQAEVSTHQTRAISLASIRLTGGIASCADYLLSVIEDEDAPPSVRVRAALGWLDKQIKFVEVNEILLRLEALEAVTNV